MKQNDFPWWGHLIALFGMYLAVAFMLGLWQHPIQIPFVYKWDAVFYALEAKMPFWPWWKDSMAGLPHGLNLADHPDFDLIQLLPLKVIYTLTGRAFLACNLWFLATFALCYATMFHALRILGIRGAIAALSGVLFALLPYHFHRGNMHLFLSGYFAIPFVLTLSLWARKSPLVGTRGWRWALPQAILLSTSIYYTLLSLLMMTLSFLMEPDQPWKLRPWKRLAFLSCILGFGVFLTVAPFFIQKWTAGENTEVSARSFAESDPLGLRMTQLVVPSADHPVAFMAQWGQRIRSEFQPALETEWSNLGLLGTAGFLGLLFLVLRPGLNHHPVAGPLARMNLSMLLFATAGGFGFLFSLTILPILRAQNRASIFIGLFSVTAVALFLDRVVLPKLGARWTSVVLALLIPVCLWEQTGSAFQIKTRAIQSEYHRTLRLVHAVEARFGGPKGAPIRLFQIPFIPFPENPTVYQMSDYDHFKPYIQGHRLAISYGITRGRGLDEVNRRTAALTPRDMAQACKDQGFHGIWINGGGYSNAGREVLEGFRALDPSRFLVETSPKGDLAFFDLTGFAGEPRPK